MTTRQTTLDKFLNRHIGTIAASLLVAALVGGYGLVHQNDTNNKLTLQKIEILAQRVLELQETIEKLRDKLDRASADRWTRADQVIYSDKVDKRLRVLENRIYQLEKSK